MSSTVKTAVRNKSRFSKVLLVDASATDANSAMTTESTKAAPRATTFDSDGGCVACIVVKKLKSVLVLLDKQISLEKHGETTKAGRGSFRHYVKPAERSSGRG